MTIAQDLNNAWSYVVGQCTYYVARLLSWVPAGLGNAGEWLRNAQAKGLVTTTTPTVGSVAVYRPGGGYSEFGHVAVVTEVLPDRTFRVSEMNFSGGPGVVDERLSTLAGVEGFILPPGVQPGAGAGLQQLGSGPAGLPTPGDLAGAVGAGIGQGLSAAASSIGHGLANAATVAWRDVGIFAAHNLVALVVAAVFVMVLFL